jgi:hypothetical protein
MPRDVRQHTRTDPRTGRPVTVRHHTRTGSAGKAKRKRGPNLPHAAKLGRRSVIHAKRGRKGRAVGVAALALGEVVAFLTLNGTSLVLALVAGVLIGLSVLLAK